MFLLTDMLTWWYSVGWLQRITDMRTVVFGWADYFAFGTLLRTLFEPWKQIVSITDSDSSISARQSALIDNLVSRFVGFWVRISVLVFGICLVIFMIILHAAYVFFWPFIPILPLLVIIAGTI